MDTCPYNSQHWTEHIVCPKWSRWRTDIYTCKIDRTQPLKRKTVHPQYISTTKWILFSSKKFTTCILQCQNKVYYKALDVFCHTLFVWCPDHFTYSSWMLRKLSFRQNWLVWIFSFASKHRCFRVFPAFLLSWALVFLTDTGSAYKRV